MISGLVEPFMPGGRVYREFLFLLESGEIREFPVDNGMELAVQVAMLCNISAQLGEPVIFQYSGLSITVALPNRLNDKDIP